MALCIQPPCLHGVVLSSLSVGRVVVQEVSRRLSTAAARVRVRVKTCGICGGQSGALAGFLGVLRRIPVCAAHLSPSIIIRGCYRPQCQWTRFHFMKRNKKILKHRGTCFTELYPRKWSLIAISVRTSNTALVKSVENKVWNWPQSSVELSFRLRSRRSAVTRMQLNAYAQKHRRCSFWTFKTYSYYTSPERFFSLSCFWHLGHNCCCCCRSQWGCYPHEIFRVCTALIDYHLYN
jgi:hypothetical protein